MVLAVRAAWDQCGLVMRRICSVQCWALQLLLYGAAAGQVGAFAWSSSVVGVALWMEGG